MFLPHPRVKVSIAGSLRDREVACSASDRQGSNFESCVWRTVSSQSSHHPQEVLLAQFSLYVHKGGLKPDSFTIGRNKKLLMRFVTASDADAALTGTLLTETSVEANPDNVDTLCLEENVDINSLRRYFDDDGWLCVQQVFRKKEDQPNWRCDECTEDMMLHDSICCDACLHWFYLPCLGIKTAPRVQKWFREPCK